MTELITELGGTVIHSVQYDSSATHLLSRKLSRSEKILASIASGTWILTMDYLPACKKHGYFVKVSNNQYTRAAENLPERVKIGKTASW